MIDFNKIKLRINVHLIVNYNITVRAGFLPGGDVLVPEKNGEFILTEGIYNVLFKAEGYCSQEHLILVEKNIFKKKYTLDIHPIKLEGKAAEFKGPIFSFSDAFEKVLYDDAAGSKANAFPFKTPAFEKAKSSLQFTDSIEFRKYVDRIAENCDFIKVFQEEEMPIVLISRDAEKAPDDISEAIRLIKKNDRLKVFYQAQVHGTEPASGEGALTFITEMSEGRYEEFIDKMDILVMPCCNPIGTDRFERNCGVVNINRDALSLQCKETELLHRLFVELLPEVTIDAHTFTRANGISSPHLDKALLDIRLSPAQSKNIDRSINKLSADIAQKTISDLRKQGLRSGYYGDSADPSTSRIYYGLFNTCSFLLESEGTRSGKLHFKRNVWCQLNAVKCLLKRIGGNAEYIKNIVFEARKRLSQADAASEEGNKNEVFILKHGKSKRRFFKTKQASYDLNGNIVKEDNIIYFPKRTITLAKTTRPQEYILPKNDNKTARVIKLLAKHNVDVIEGKNEYIVSTKQITSNIISTLLEPLSGDAENILTQDE